LPVISYNAISGLIRRLGALLSGDSRVMSKLTELQNELLSNIESELRRESALAYIKNGYSNKTQAYIDACETLGKKPSKNPDVSAAEILNYPSVTKFINSFKADVAERAKTDAEYVLRRLREIDDLDVIDILNDELDGFKNLSEWPKSWRTSISGLDIQTVITGGDEPIEKLVRKIKWPDKTKNLELIGRHVDVKAWDGESSGDDLPIGRIEIEVVGANNKD
jgi:phage terminase small subunit